MRPKVIRSSVETGTVETDLNKFILDKVKQLSDQFYLLVYKHHEVQIGTISNGEIKIDREDELKPELIKELRVFSKNSELYIWMQDMDIIKYRLRIDDENKGKEVAIYEEKHLMWGNRIENDDVTVYEKNRGMRFKFPFPVLQKQLPLKYQVKNYISFDKSGLIQFDDARLVSFLDCDGKEFYNGE